MQSSSQADELGLLLGTRDTLQAKEGHNSATKGA